MSIKLSKKNLQELANSLDCHCIGVGCYDYENQVSYLQGTVSNNTNVKYMNEDAKTIFEVIKRMYGDDAYICLSQIAYSAGTYGNTAQLHKMEVMQNDHVMLTLFVYYS